MRQAVALSTSVAPETRQSARLTDGRSNFDLLGLLTQLSDSTAQERRTLSLLGLAAKHLLTLDEAALLSGLSRNHLSEAIQSGKLKAKKIDGDLKVKPANLKSYTDKL